MHRSSYNPSDVADIVSLRITPLDKSRGTFTHHVYSDGTGAIKKGDTRKFSTTSEGDDKGLVQLMLAWTFLFLLEE